MSIADLVTDWGGFEQLVAKQRHRSALYLVIAGYVHSGTRHFPDLLQLRARIANDLGNRAEAMQVGLYLFHVRLALRG
jgi:hypothetical protein